MVAWAQIIGVFDLVWVIADGIRQIDNVKLECRLKQSKSFLATTL